MELTLRFTKVLLALIIVGAFSSCSISPNLQSSLESDELYLASGEEFITDAEYLAYASGALEDHDGEYYYEDEEYNNSGSNYSPYGYGNSNRFNNLGLNSYFSPFGAGYGYGSYGTGFGNYGGYGSSYGGYGSGFGNGYGGYGNGYGGYGNGYGGYGNGYGGYGNGYGGYGNGYGGYGNGYGGYNPYGYGGYFGGGSDTYTTSSIMVGPRTPLLSNSLTNSNYHGGSLMTNRRLQAQPSEVGGTNSETQQTRSNSNSESFFNRTRTPPTSTDRNGRHGIESDSNSGVQYRNKPANPNRGNRNNDGGHTPSPPSRGNSGTRPSNNNSNNRGSGTRPSNNSRGSSGRSGGRN